MILQVWYLLQTHIQTRFTCRAEGFPSYNLLWLCETVICIHWFLRWTVDSIFCKWLNNRLGEYVFSVEYTPSRLQCKQKRVDTEFPLTYTWGAERSEHARFIYNATVRKKKRYFMIWLIRNDRFHWYLCTLCASVVFCSRLIFFLSHVGT